MANFYGSLIGFGAGGAAKFTTATGGSSANVGDYTVHTFTGSGTFEVTSLGDDETVDWLLIAGGAAGFRGRLSTRFRINGVSRYLYCDNRWWRGKRSSSTIG